MCLLVQPKLLFHLKVRMKWNNMTKFAGTFYVFVNNPYFYPFSTYMWPINGQSLVAVDPYKMDDGCPILIMDYGWHGGAVQSKLR